jgi:NAD(P)-dependent dehydrogenase (short-subunit alcohol dehydrogenase family)
MLLSKGSFKGDSLKGKVAVVTGAGRGIGLEAARALVWLGANVVIAEINPENGRAAEEAINKEFGAGKAFFVKTDIGTPEDIDQLALAVQKKFGKIDIVLNNATVFPMGAVKDTSIGDWDRSYHVNLRGPVLLAQKFLPDMVKRGYGVFACVSSSGAAPFMGAYEVFKTAQVELANTLAPELEDKGVYAFTIGPGIAKTPGFCEGGGKVAELMGMTLEELFELNKNAQISPEAAGVGFALAVVQAKKYHGQETSSIQVLREANIPFDQYTVPEETVPNVPKEQAQAVKPQKRSVTELYQTVFKTFMEQSEGWKRRNLFERQWVNRDFKKNTGVSIDEMQMQLKTLGETLRTGVCSSEYLGAVNKVAVYYEHQKEQLKGFEKNPQKLEMNLQILDGWIEDAKALAQTLPQ